METKFEAFPYEAYSIQIDFMNALYQSLDKGGIAMLESPTGTGKTLSIICSALQWLVDKKLQSKQGNCESTDNFNQNGKAEDQNSLDDDDDEPDWMKNFAVKKENELSPKKTKVEKKVGLRSKKFDNKKKKEGCVRDIFSRVGEEEEEDEKGEAYGKKERKVLRVKSRGEEVDDEEEFLLEEYESEEENGGCGKRKGKSSVLIASSSEDEEDDDGLENEGDEARLKIYFCSRTHSQLSQFIKELNKTKFADELKVVCLGSRKNLCINQEVLKLGSSTRINERCLELQKNSKSETSKMKNLGSGGKVRRKKASSGCPMLRSHKLVKEFRSEVFEQGPLDIEDVIQIGSKLGTCPYYGSRSMVSEADLVVLPYQSLLSKSSRESLGLTLKNSIIIIDEAHNLADSLIHMYDSKITLSQLDNVYIHLEKYMERFRNVLGPGNRRYIQTLMVLTRAFQKILREENDASSTDPLCKPEEIRSALNYSVSINEFLFSHNIDNINLVKILQYIEDSNIIHKVSGYGDKLAITHDASTNGSEVEIEENSTLSSFRALASMLLSLTNRDGDGRIIVSRTKLLCSGQKNGHLKYVMLTGEKIFFEIVDQAHAVVLAGGTLQPIEETQERLFPWLPPDQLHFFSCGHIIPSENILPVAVSHGPSGQSFDFSYSARSSSSMIQELGLLLCNLVAVVPEGVVVFFSSFDYEEKVYNCWKETGILTRIMKKKQIFREPRKNTDVEVVLNDYRETIGALSRTESKTDQSVCNGAILLAVVGGKISEGINFSDGMGRCIIMVGLPYPNASDIELMERLKHIEGVQGGPTSNAPKSLACTECYNGDIKAGLDILRSCKRRGKQYYENLCMKAVNQSIGRAIRHSNDYAAILLVDGRYASDPSKKCFSHPTNKLPQWIKGRLIPTTANYGEVHKVLRQFFKLHRTKENS